MQITEVAKGVVAALLTDLVKSKTSLASQVLGAIAVLGVLGVVLLSGFWRALAVVVLVLCLGGLVFVFLSRRMALGMVARIAPPTELSGVRGHFDAALAEADLPTGPAGFLRLIWRLRKGVGPEVERLGEVVARLQQELGPDLDAD